MQPPDELMSDVFLPAVRHLVSVRLRAQGLSQSKISSLLGVTQASVSMYLSSPPERAYDQLGKFEVKHEQADGYSAHLAESLLKGPATGVRELETVWTGLLGAGSVCRAHREMYPALADCDYCIIEYGRKSSKSSIISDVAAAASLLEGSPDFIRIMPEVSVNIACVSPGATAAADVVAIPGRIVRVKDRARAMLPPEPGASAHMSRMLLLAMSRWPKLTACVNVLYDKKMGRVLRRNGIKTISIGGYRRARDEDPTVEAFGRRLATSVPQFDAVVDEGGAGTEPNVYLFAGSATEAVRTALKLAAAYSAG